MTPHLRKNTIMAPNQRDPDKKMLRLWIEKDRLQLFKEYAESTGLSMTAILTAFIVEKTNQYRKDKWKKN